MIQICVTSELRYRVTYFLEGVRCAQMECSELHTALDEIQKNMKMEMGIAKGKVFTTATGREI